MKLLKYYKTLKPLIVQGDSERPNWVKNCFPRNKNAKDPNFQD